jgi:hypothetical protein
MIVAMAWRLTRRRSGHESLAQRIVELGRSDDVDPVPDFVEPVLRELEEGPQRLAGRGRRWFTIAVSASAVAFAAVAIVPAARTEVLSILGIRGVEVTRISQLPQTAVRRSSHFGRRVSLAQARRQVAFTIVLARGRAPNIVFLAGPNSGIPGGRVSLVYGRPQRPRLLVQEFLGASPGPELTKGVPPKTTVEPVRVGPHRGLWFGGSHMLSFVDADRVTRDDWTRLAGKTLVWRKGAVLIRMEGTFGKRQAIELARLFR